MSSAEKVVVFHPKSLLLTETQMLEGFIQVKMKGLEKQVSIYLQAQILTGTSM